MTRKGGFYGVRVGRIPGVYRTWQEASDQTSHFPNARHRKFSTYDEARAFVYGAAGEAQPTQTQANPRRPLVHGKPPSVNTAAAAATSSISARRNDLVVIDDDGMDPRPDVHSFLPSPPPPYARDAPQEPVSAAKGVSPNQSSTTTAEHASIVAKPTLSAFSDNAGTDTLTAEQLADPWHSPPITTHRKEHRKTECEFQRDTKREKDLVQERLREAEPLLRLFGINPNETVAPTQTVKTDSLKQEMHPPPSAHVHEQSPSTNLLDSLAILSPEQRELIWNLEKGNNVFLTGSAGTGKSVSLRMAIEYLRMKMKRVGVTAPTGVAAQQVGGVTINSFAKLGSEPFNPAKILSNNIANSENWDG
ncbi:hypothetical protein BC830DRAFT_927639 [Chytriomyces sp. MP71]|nr:hypothetical protein BC830DRAFT_927639 [Chytriomyces sp. MP71]